MIDVEQSRTLCKTHTIRLMDYSMECGRNYNNKYITVLYFCLKYVKKMRKKTGKRNNDSRQRNMRVFMFMLHSEACDPLNGKEFRLNYKHVEYCAWSTVSCRQILTPSLIYKYELLNQFVGTHNDFCCCHLILFCLYLNYISFIRRV